MKNLNNIEPEPTQLIPLWNSPQKNLQLVYLSWVYLFVSMKPVLKHRYTENQPIDLPTICSFHPHNIWSFNVFSQLLRLKRICSGISDYEHKVNIINQSLLSWDYPCKLISQQMNRASHIVRTKSMTCMSNKNTNEKRITFITQFHPSIATFK